MRYIVEYKLLDGTKMQCILSGSNQNEVKHKSFRVFKSLYEKRVVRGKKYNVTGSNIVSVEKWNVQYDKINEGLRVFSVIITDFHGNQYSSTRCKAQGYKSAYNKLTKDGKDGGSFIIFLYDNSQKSILKSSTSEARKVLTSKTKTVETFNKACAKTKELEGTVDVNFLEEIPLLCSMVYDYCKGYYKEVPLRTIIGATAAIVYFVSPVDLIPDFIPVIGQADDVAVIGYALKCVHGDLMKYKAYRETDEYKENKAKKIRERAQAKKLREAQRSA